MIEYRRENLQNMPFDKTVNASLWLDKYLKDDGDEAKKNLVQEVVSVEVSKAYEDFYRHWTDALTKQSIMTKEAETLGRLAVNLGAEAVLENSIALNRTYGVPYIPGSALKGLASHYAKSSLGDAWAEKSPNNKTLFGAEDEAGYVNFFDALYIPKSGKCLVADVVTVHHQEYYQGGGVPPADWDSPIPNHFLTAHGKFLLALSGREDWVRAGFEVLKLALANEGIGAKTSSGYGRMKLIG